MLHSCLTLLTSSVQKKIYTFLKNKEKFQMNDTTIRNLKACLHKFKTIFCIKNISDFGMESCERRVAFLGSLGYS